MVSGVYTVQSPGKYRMAAGLLISGTFALNTQTSLELQKNGTAFCSKQEYAGGAITRANPFLSDTIECVAGDTLRVQAACGATTPAILASAPHNFISIERVGN
jgi:hypothetical protein